MTASFSSRIRRRRIGGGLLLSWRAGIRLARRSMAESSKRMRASVRRAESRGRGGLATVRETGGRVVPP